MMGLKSKPNIDDLRESLAKYITMKFESKSHHSDTRFAMMFQSKLQHGILHFLGTPETLVVVNFTGITNQLTFRRKSADD